MRKTFSLGLLAVMAVSWWGCSRLNTTNRYLADVGVVGPDGEVILFFRKGDNIVVQRCKDLDILNTREDCAVQSETKVAVPEFKDSLKRALKLPGGNYGGQVKRKIEIYNNSASNVTPDLERQRDELKGKIADINAFISDPRFGVKNAGIHNDRLVNLREGLSQVEAKLGYPKELNQIIGEINGQIDRLVDDITSSEHIKYYTYSNNKTDFFFNILRAYFGQKPMLSFKIIKRGNFVMGSPRSEADRNGNEGAINVTISKSFEIMTKEVTQKQWFKVMGYNPSYFKRRPYCDRHRVINGVALCPNNPVEGVSWRDVRRFIGKLNRDTGVFGCRGTPQDNKGCYRLPTEAEWEFAARGKTMSAYSFGSDTIGDYAWYRGNADNQTHPVGKLKPNPYGLFDMHGNVGEWVQDKHRRKLPGGVDPLHVASFPKRDFRSNRGIRGGSCYRFAQDLRSATRSAGNPGGRHYMVGFRLVRTR